MNNLECYLPTFQNLTNDQIDSINKHSFVVNYKKNETVFRQDMPISHIVFLKSGLVKIYKESSVNKFNILHITSSNNFIGLLSAFSKIQYDNSAKVLQDSEVVFTDIHVFKNIIRENGKYALQIMSLMGSQGLSLSEKLINHSQKQVHGRIAEIILFFSNDIFKCNTFEFPLSRQELADLISSTKETVSRTLSEFKNDKLIDVDDKKITLKSIELLNVLSRIG